MDSAPQSQPVHVSENARQSESLLHGPPPGGGGQISCVHAPPGAVQIPQLALQQTWPAGHVVGPQATGFGSHVP